MTPLRGLRQQRLSIYSGRGVGARGSGHAYAVALAGGSAGIRSEIAQVQGLFYSVMASP
jgi:hypothetical protein